MCSLHFCCQPNLQLRLTLGCMVNRSIARSVSILSSRSDTGGLLTLGTKTFGGGPGDCMTLGTVEVAEFRVLSMRLLNDDKLDVSKSP